MSRFLITALLLAMSMAAGADEVSDDAAIRATIDHYFVANDRCDPERLGVAFQPGTIMFWVDAGRLQSRDQKSWKARLSDDKCPAAALERSVVWIDQAGDSASAETWSRFDDRTFRDYLLLLRIEGRWRIVGKVFERQAGGNATAPEDAERQAGSVRAIEALLRRKFAAMDDNDGRLLASVYLPQAQTTTLVNRELVAWPIAEWSARFDADAAAGTFPQGVERRIDRIQATGNVGWARFTHTRAGSRTVDYAVLVRDEGVWHIAHLTYETLPLESANTAQRQSGRTP